MKARCEFDSDVAVSLLFLDVTDDNWIRRIRPRRVPESIAPEFDCVCSGVQEAWRVEVSRKAITKEQKLEESEISMQCY